MGQVENKAAVGGIRRIRSGRPRVSDWDECSRCGLGGAHGRSLTSERRVQGLRGYQRLFDLVADGTEIAKFEIQPIAAEGDTVVAKGVQTYRVKATGKSTTATLIHIFTLGEMER